MNIHRMGRWGVGNAQKNIYKYSDAEHKNRMGCCEWLPEDGDLCVCVAHSGDYFNNYAAMRIQENGAYKMVGEFGAYCFGESIGELSKRDFHLLQAGEEITLNKKALAKEGTRA